MRDKDGNPVSGTYTPSTDTALAMVEVALNAANANGILAHEDWHAVEDMLREIGAEGQKLLGIVRSASSKPHVVRWMVEQLVKRGETLEGDAIQQLNDPAERAAYAFQFFIQREYSKRDYRDCITN